MHEQNAKLLKKNGFKNLDEIASETFVKKKINVENFKTKIFPDNTVAYSKSTDSYIQVKSFDEPSKTYTCKVVKTDSSPAEEKKLPKDDITKYIMIRVNLIGSEMLADSDKNDDALEIKVNIDDKISKLGVYSAKGTQSDKIDGFMSTLGKLIPSPDETTFYKQFIKNG